MWTQICKSRTLAIWWVSINEKSESSHRIDDDNVRVFFAAFFYATCRKQRGRRLEAANSIWKSYIYKGATFHKYFTAVNIIIFMLLSLLPFVNAADAKNAARGVSLHSFAKLWELLACFDISAIFTYVSNMCVIVVDAFKYSWNARLNCCYNFWCNTMLILTSKCTAFLRTLMPHTNCIHTYICEYVNVCACTIHVSQGRPGCVWESREELNYLENRICCLQMIYLRLFLTFSGSQQPNAAFARGNITPGHNQHWHNRSCSPR